MASMLLVPMIWLRSDGSEPARPEFALSDGPPATWLHPERLVADSAPVVPVTRTSVVSSGAAGGGSVSAASASFAAAAKPTTTTTAAAAATTTSVAGRPAAPATTTTTARAVATLSPAAVTTTTTAARVATTTTTTAAAALPPPGGASVAAAQKFGTHTDRGVASWFNAPDGTCAHRDIPFGTVVRVTRLYNGAVTTCVVGQWGPEDSTRLIDLSMDTFEKLAYPEAGLIDVVLEW